MRVSATYGMPASNGRSTFESAEAVLSWQFKNPGAATPGFFTKGRPECTGLPFPSFQSGVRLRMTENPCACALRHENNVSVKKGPSPEGKFLVWCFKASRNVQQANNPHRPEQ